MEPSQVKPIATGPPAQSHESTPIQASGSLPFEELLDAHVDRARQEASEKERKHLESIAAPTAQSQNAWAGPVDPHQSEGPQHPAEEPVSEDSWESEPITPKERTENEPMATDPSPPDPTVQPPGGETQNHDPALINPDPQLLDQAIQPIEVQSDQTNALESGSATAETMLTPSLRAQSSDMVPANPSMEKAAPIPQSTPVEKELPTSDQIVEPGPSPIRSKPPVKDMPSNSTGPGSTDLPPEIQAGKSQIHSLPLLNRTDGDSKVNTLFERTAFQVESISLEPDQVGVEPQAIHQQTQPPNPIAMDLGTRIQNPSPTGEPARLAEAQAPNLIQQISEGMETLTKTGRSTLRLQLNPPDLGRIQLRIQSDSEGLKVVLTADQANTSGLLERHMDDLRQSMARSGVQLAGLTIGHRSNSQPFTELPGKRSKMGLDSRSAKAPSEDSALTLSPVADFQSDSNVDYRI